MRRTLAACLGVIVVACALPAHGTYIAVDDFESYTVGAFNGNTTAEDVWNSTNGGEDLGSGLVAIQDDGSTQHLAFGWNSGFRGAYRATTPIAQGDIGVYYFQVRSTTATPNASYGLSDEVSVASGFNAFEIQVALLSDVDGQFKLGGRSGGVVVDLATGLDVDTWYDVWLEVDNANEKYNVYFGTSGDPNSVGALVGSDLDFRVGRGNDLVTFLALGGAADLGHHLDNIHFKAGVIPEPTSLSSIVLGMMMLFSGVRRVRS